jgi:hypothetical protein
MEFIRCTKAIITISPLQRKRRWKWRLLKSGASAGKLGNAKLPRLGSVFG